MHAHRVVGDRRLLLRDKEWNTERVRRLRRRADVEEGIGRGDERVELPLHEELVEQAQQTARILPAMLVQVVASIRLQPGTDLFREDLQRLPPEEVERDDTDLAPVAEFLAEALDVGPEVVVEDENAHAVMLCGASKPDGLLERRLQQAALLAGEADQVVGGRREPTERDARITTTPRLSLRFARYKSGPAVAACAKKPGTAGNTTCRSHSPRRTPNSRKKNQRSGGQASACAIERPEDHALDAEWMHERDGDREVHEKVRGRDE